MSKPTEIEFGDSSIRTPSTLSGMTIHSTHKAMFPSSGDANGTRGQLIKSKLEQSGRHKRSKEILLWQLYWNVFAGMWYGQDQLYRRGDQLGVDAQTEKSPSDSEGVERCKGKLSVTVGERRGLSFRLGEKSNRRTLVSPFKLFFGGVVFCTIPT